MLSFITVCRRLHGNIHSNLNFFYPIFIFFLKLYSHSKSSPMKLDSNDNLNNVAKNYVYESVEKIKKKKKQSLCPAPKLL